MWKVCPAWNRQRRQLIKAVGSDLSLRVIIEVMLNIEEKRQAIVAFCGEVMTLKEDSERARRGGQHASGSGGVEVTSRFPCGGEFQLRLGLGGESGRRGYEPRLPFLSPPRVTAYGPVLRALSLKWMIRIGLFFHASANRSRLLC